MSQLLSLLFAKMVEPTPLALHSGFIVATTFSFASIFFHFLFNFPFTNAHLLLSSQKAISRLSLVWTQIVTPLQISYCFSLTHNPYFISTHSKSLFFFPPTHSLGSIAQQPFKRIHVHAYKITKTTPTTSLIYTSMAISYSKLPSLSHTHCHFYFPNSKKPIPISHQIP